MCVDAKEDVAKAVQSYPDGGAIPSLSGVVVSESMNVKGFRDTLDCIAGKGCVEIPMLVLGGAVGAGLSTTSTGAAALSMGKDIGLLIGKKAVKYPLLTEMTATAIANTGYQLTQDQAYDPYSLLQAELSTVLTRGRTLGQQISINIGISSMARHKIQKIMVRMLLVRLLVH